MLECFEVLKAVQFAEFCHRRQLRKYYPTPVPYVVHCFAVAEKVATCSLPLNLSSHRLSLVQAALLHDVLEDCEVATFDTLKTEFGDGVALMVKALTDDPVTPGGPNRATRKLRTQKRLSLCGDGPKVIKCADILDNMESIIEYNPEFAKVFLQEVEDLLPVLQPSTGYCSLYAELGDQINLNKGAINA